MANPQLENGYTRIANELLEALCRLKISGNEMRLLLDIIRSTYGFQKKSAELSLSVLEKAVGIRKSHISESLKRLSEAGIITVQQNVGTAPQTIAVQKDYEKWKPLRKQEQVTENRNTESSANEEIPIPENSNRTFPENSNHTYNKEKEKDKSKERVKKRIPHGRYGNILLTEEEYSELVSDFGKYAADNCIQKADTYIETTGRSYRSTEAVVRKWLTEDCSSKPKDDDVSEYAAFVNQF